MPHSRKPDSNESASLNNSPLLLPNGAADHLRAALDQSRRLLKTTKDDSGIWHLAKLLSHLKELDDLLE